MKVRMDRWVEEGRKESKRKIHGWWTKGRMERKKQGTKEGRADRWKERGKEG